MKIERTPKIVDPVVEGIVGDASLLVAAAVPTQTESAAQVARKATESVIKAHEETSGKKLSSDQKEQIISGSLSALD
jgi:hypothetical protein